MLHETHPVIKQKTDTLITAKKYHELYSQSVQDPEAFWGSQAKEYLTWFKPWEKVLSGSFEQHEVNWFVGGEINATYNCLDRHLDRHAHQPAVIWESNDPDLSQTLTYAQLYERVCCFANVLKYQGIKKGSRVCIYLPMIPEAIIAMLACARIGAIHTVVFAGFSSESLRARIEDAQCELIVTANEGLRGNKKISLKEYVDTAIWDNPNVKAVIVVKRTDATIPWNPARDKWYEEAIKEVKNQCPAEKMDATDPLFVLYTSGSTGKPKGILHSTAGYLLHAAITFKFIFDYQPGEIYWCTADVGWITGHTYGVYGPLLNAGTLLIFEGIPSYPTPARYWEIIDKHKVNIFYTAPTALRALRRESNEWIQKTSRKSLRILGTVGEPINPDVWEWYYHTIGDGRCAIVDTWWQTETGGIMISPFPGATPLKPGFASWPFFGVVPDILDEQGQSIKDAKMGKLVISKPWPGMMRTILGDQKRFIETYLETFPGHYLTGDQAYRDIEGYFVILGRDDDVIKVSGHRIGSQEVESALLRHTAVSEAAVVAVPDDITGQSIYAYVTLKKGIEPSSQLKKEMVEKVRNVIGPIAQPKHIEWANELPKTRSGKIMRRILRKIANKETDELGDLSTLADPNVVNELIKSNKK